MDDSSNLTRNRIVEHLEKLSRTIGARPGGTPANAQAAHYIEAALRAAGASVERIEFACPEWSAGETILEVAGRRLEVAANTFSPPCDVTAPLEVVATLEQLRAANLAGRIAVFCGELSSATYSPQSWFLFSEKERQILGLLADKTPAALVTVQQRLDSLEHLFEDHEFTLPSATASARDGLALLAAAGQQATLLITTQRSAGRTWDLVARAGPRTGPRITFCAHYDTKFDTPGALDNGAGVCVLLALAERLGRANLNVGLEWIAFGNEEHIPEGTGFYMEKYGDSLSDVIALVNFDGAGHALDIDTVMVMGGSDDLRAAVDALLPAYPHLIWTEPWYESNHTLFAWRGVPSLALTSPATRHLNHGPQDAPEWVNPSRLAALVDFSAALAAALAHKTPTWSRAEEQTT